uniref:DDE Tnp4 domain-containing protein n=1 Tax=Amphimedon queenslandica TaxID=400682 RepID=A0A1X7UVI9_AMPQE
MRLADPESHFMYLRMKRETFDVLVRVVTPYLTRRRYISGNRPSITPAEKLALTLRFLATGNSQISLSFNFKMGWATVSKVLHETCCAIWDALVSSYLKFPQSIEEWKAISLQFWRSWNFPNCFGAIDGKHVVIQASNNSGSTYYNYKGTFSVVLLAVCDAYYQFLMVDIGGNGKESDGGILSYSSCGTSLEMDSINLPDPTSLPDQSDLKAPYVFVGDDGFPLGTNLLKPFPRNNNITKDNRARRTIENAFGILAARFRIFKRPINATPDHV